MDIVLFLAIVSVGLYHSVHLVRMNRYLATTHPAIWEKIKLKRFFGIPAEDLPFPRGHWLKELWFAFSPDNLDDESLSKLKTRTKFSFLLLLVLILSLFFLT